MEQAIFWILSSLAVASALAVVFFRKAVNSVMSLLAFMIVVAGLFLLLGAQLVAVFQVLVYAGAVLVLFIFVVMLLNLKDAKATGHPSRSTAAVGITSVLLTLGMMAMLWLAVRHPAAAYAPSVLKPAAGIRQIAIDLFNAHLLIFELTSVVLFVAAVCALVISRKEGERP